MIEQRWKFPDDKWSDWIDANADFWSGEDPIPDGVKLLLTDMEAGYLPVTTVTVRFKRTNRPSRFRPDEMWVQYRLKEES